MQGHLPMFPRNPTRSKILLGVPRRSGILKGVRLGATKQTRARMSRRIGLMDAGPAWEEGVSVSRIRVGHAGGSFFGMGVAHYSEEHRSMSEGLGIDTPWLAAYAIRPFLVVVPSQATRRPLGARAVYAHV